MPKKPTAADAQLILQLYDFRREAEMRKARHWFNGTFWPATADDVLKVSSNFNLPENAWFRQVITYWEMTAVMVLQGALNEELFFGTNTEMWFTFAKLYPTLKEFRQKSGSPDAWKHIETLATHTKQGKERLNALVKRVAGFRQQMAEAAGKGK
jgi:hypothetical protein